MPISVNIAKNSRKSFSANINGAMIKNIKQREDIRKPPPDYVRGNSKSIAKSNRLWKQMNRYWIWRFQRAATAEKFGGAPEMHKVPRMRGFGRGNVALLKRQRGRKFEGRRWRFSFQI